MLSGVRRAKTSISSWSGHPEGPDGDSSTPTSASSSWGVIQPKAFSPLRSSTPNGIHSIPLASAASIISSAYESVAADFDAAHLAPRRTVLSAPDEAAAHIRRSGVVEKEAVRRAHQASTKAFEDRLGTAYADLYKMWFPEFLSADDEAEYAGNEVDTKTRSHMCLTCICLSVAFIAINAMRIFDAGSIPESERTFFYCAWCLQFIFVESIVLLRCLRCLAQDTLWSIWGCVVASSAMWADSWILGVLVSGDRQHLRTRARDDTVLVLSLVVLLASVLQAPMRSRQAFIVVLVCPMCYVVSRLPDARAPEGGSSAGVACLLVVNSFCVWNIRRQHDVLSRVSWLRAKCVDSQSDMISDLALDVEFWRQSSMKKSMSEPEDPEKMRQRQAVSQAIEAGDAEGLADARRGLQPYMSEEEIAITIQMEGKKQSEEGGIILAYLVSEQFSRLAKQRSREENPHFYRLKDKFFFGEHAIGRDMTCPRDGKIGCSMLDALPRVCRKKCTHFLSWTWAYRLDMFRSCLDAWALQQNLNPMSVFLYCCFFANNQFRILVDGTANGSDELGLIFEARLERIGKVVAMVDTWKRPEYLTRIWTIFEQARAVDLGIPVHFVLPPDASESLIAKLETGREGIEEVKHELLDIDSERAQAYSKEDEQRVKAQIRETIGFIAVNHAVTRNLGSWIGQVVRNHFNKLTEVPNQSRRVTARNLNVEWTQEFADSETPEFWISDIAGFLSAYDTGAPDTASESANLEVSGVPHENTQRAELEAERESMSFGSTTTFV